VDTRYSIFDVNVPPYHKRCTYYGIVQQQFGLQTPHSNLSRLAILVGHGYDMVARLQSQCKAVVYRCA
jgi:hypothetical protein